MMIRLIMTIKTLSKLEQSFNGLKLFTSFMNAFQSLSSFMFFIMRNASI